MFILPLCCFFGFCLANRVLCAIVGNTQICAKTTVLLVSRLFPCGFCADLRTNGRFRSFSGSPVVPIFQRSEPPTTQTQLRRVLPRRLDGMACMNGSDLGRSDLGCACRMVGLPASHRKAGTGARGGVSKIRFAAGNHAVAQGSETWTTTLPRLRPESTRRWASAMKARG